MNLEPTGINRGDGKRPDGITLFPWKDGRCLVWDSTIVDTFADSNLIPCSLAPGAGANAAEVRKKAKYRNISESHIFQPIALETTGTVGTSTGAFLRTLCSYLVRETGDNREAAWLRQRLSIAIARGNAASVRGSVSGSWFLASLLEEEQADYLHCLRQVLP